ncbi:uncharacterized protein FA14DRAFT_162457 [Meira miltonrushii]|uniref:Uncharacterized protein n=1 Tax=Meira miltonrushii TaxID=1280837 RepID=A0A316V406_9BASI|nr:uncharacterized protein FA14DRAFT_162457 [Meira miltonrushii]PWN32289.1 hypothetical protein FA14DRAFT_162457 [Meira miltonrushii]
MSTGQNESSSSDRTSNLPNQFASCTMMLFERTLFALNFISIVRITKRTDSIRMI